MKILFYGRLAEALGSEIDLPFDSPCSIAELRSRIAQSRPEAAGPLQSGRVRACIGDSIVNEDQLVAPGSRVEFLPPVSGG